MIFPAIMFYIFAAVTVASGVLVVSARNPVHSVLFLILAFFNSAGLFILLGAEFLAMILVVVYVGAVAVLFLFVVMMLDIDFAELRSGFMRYLPIGALIGFVLLAELVLVFGHWVIAPGVAGLHGGAAAGHRGRAADQHPGARQPALHALPVRVPDGGRDPARRDDRRDRADLARSASGCAASAFRSSSARTRAEAVAIVKVPLGGAVAEPVASRENRPMARSASRIT